MNFESNEEELFMDNKEEKEELIEYEGEIHLHRKYDYLPYTVHRIDRILASMGCRKERIFQGYKANRRFGYCEKYRIICIEDGKIIVSCIDLDSLRRFFAREDLPLEDEKSITRKRKKGIEVFRDVYKQRVKEQVHNNDSNGETNGENSTDNK